MDEAEERHYSVSLPPLLVYFDLKQVTQAKICRLIFLVLSNFSAMLKDGRVEADDVYDCPVYRFVLASSNIFHILIPHSESIF